MATRADRRTAQEFQKEYFSDILNNFDTNPVTGLLARVVNEDSIKQSLKNIVRTCLTERFYQPLVGSKAASSLFDLGGPIVIETIRNTITTAITNYEKRANLIQVTTTDQDYGYVADIAFECINIPNQTFYTSVIIEKVR